MILLLFSYTRTGSRINARLTLNQLYSYINSSMEPVSMENLGNQDFHETEELSLLERVGRDRLVSKGTSEKVDETKQDIFLER